MGNQVVYGQRECEICGEVTPHRITQVRAGDGHVIADPGECLMHRKWVDGRIERLVNGEWTTVRPPDADA